MNSCDHLQMPPSHKESKKLGIGHYNRKIVFSKLKIKNKGQW